MKKYLGMLALLCGTLASGSALAGPTYLTEEQSVAAAAILCKSMASEKYTLECKPEAQLLTLIIPNKSGVDEDTMAIALTIMSETLCQNLYSGMKGYHFADGWRVNLKAKGGKNVLMNCPLDDY